MQKALKTSVGIMVVELGIKMGKILWSLLYCKHDSQKYILQEKDISNITYESSPPKTQVDYFLVMGYKWKILKDIKSYRGKSISTSISHWCFFNITKSQWRLKRLRSEARICFRENQNKSKAPFLKNASSGTLSCNASL